MNKIMKSGEILDIQKQMEIIKQGVEEIIPENELIKNSIILTRKIFHSG